MMMGMMTEFCGRRQISSRILLSYTFVYGESSQG
jgi:hypothetical protein